MANIVWEGDDTPDWNTGSNWVGGTKPGASDVAVFDGAVSSLDCLLDSDESILGISVEADYEGTIDLGNTAQTLSLGTSGGVIAGHANSTFNLGDCTVAITGAPWTVVDHAGAWNRGTGTVVFVGTCTINTGTTNDFYNLTVTSGTTTISINNSEVINACTINGTLSVDTGRILFVSSSCTVIVSDGGRLTGSGTGIVRFTIPATGKGVTSFHSGGTWDVPVTQILRPATDAVFVPGNYQSAVKVYNNSGDNGTLTLDNDVYQFDSFELETISTGSITLANNTNGPTSITINGDLTFDRNSSGVITVNDSGVATDWVITGDVIDESASGITWTKGTGDITLSGSADQDIDFMGQSIEALEVNKSAGDVTISGAFTTVSFTGTSTGTGDFDPNGQTITVTGNCSWAAAFDLNSGATTMNGCSWIVSGNFTADGQTLNATASWVLTVTGTAVASGTGEVEYSNAGAGTEIKANSGPWTDGGSNTNWNFVAFIGNAQIGEGFDERHGMDFLPWPASSAQAVI